MALEKKWTLKNSDEASENLLQDSLKINIKLCRLLVQRGITTYEDARSFFRPELNMLHNPFLMKDMDKATDRVLAAFHNKEKIMVFGDYDVDGTTAVAVAFSFLKKNYPENLGDTHCQYYIPHRYTEGYGISFQGIDKAVNDGCKLMIALDCGIKAVDKIKYAKEKGLDVIVCDHHTPGDELPEAFAILNPKQNDCNYPYKELSGCGIGYKLICAIAEKMDLPYEAVAIYLDLVATSIAADIVPLNGENRILAHFGLIRANTAPCKALTAIKNIAALKRDFTISDLVFIIAPRINAAGRMDDAAKVVALLTEDDEQNAFALALSIHTDNSERKEVDQSMSDEALAIISEEESDNPKYSNVLFRPYWHKGVVGIVASRVIEHYYRPTIVLTESNGKITGSARSVAGFNIYDAINDCSDLLENFGGHFFAAGLTMLPENLDAFRAKFEETVKNTISPQSLIPELQIDAELDFSEITPTFYKIIKQFEPFGPTNLNPVFVTRNVSNKNGMSKIVKELHVRFVVAQSDSYAFVGIGFGMADKFDVVASGKPFDIVYTIDENEWNGQKSLQLKVLDIRASE